MTDKFELLRAANPVPEPAPFAPEMRERIIGKVVARDRRTRPFQRLLMALTRGRVVALAAGALLLAGGTATAVVALTDQPSAPPSGSLHPGPGVTRSLSYHVVALPDLNGGAVGWCLFDSEQVPIGYEGGGSCGDVQLRGHSIVALDAGSGSSRVNRPPAGRLRIGTRLTYVSYEYVAYVTTAAVAAVRVAPSLTIRTRPDYQLPNGYRIAVWIRAHLVYRYVSRKRGRPPAISRLVTNTLPSLHVSDAVALDASGRVIGVPGAPFASLHDAATFWQAQRTSSPRPSHHSPPAGACEIDTSGLPHIQLFFGSVVQHADGFPELDGRTFLSCAETQFGAGAGLGVDAAILLDAQHPGSLPEAIAGATTVGPGIVNVPSTALGQHKALTARRVGDAWLAIEAGGTLGQRIRILNRLRVCVRLGPTPCPSP